MFAAITSAIRRKRKATSAQVAANRRNATKSTGPRNEPGKAVARFNAVEYGLRATIPVLPGEDRQALEERRGAGAERTQFLRKPVRVLADFLSQQCE